MYALILISYIDNRPNSVCTSRVSLVSCDKGTLNFRFDSWEQDHRCWSLCWCSHNVQSIPLIPRIKGTDEWPLQGIVHHDLSPQQIAIFVYDPGRACNDDTRNFCGGICRADAVQASHTNDQGTQRYMAFTRCSTEVVLPA
jgi:hypothetical protein